MGANHRCEFSIALRAWPAGKGNAILLKEFVPLVSELGMDPGEAISDMIAQASTRIALVYADLLAQGVAEADIAGAMLGATLTLYDALGLAAAIPMILRSTADQVERQRSILIN